MADSEVCLESGPSEGEVRGALARILESDDFRASPRLRRFLAFVVEETLAGRTEEIRSYFIGTRVFGRDESFNPNVDPIVRVEAGRLRRAMQEYYLRVGDREAVRLDIPSGAYVPRFARNGRPEERSSLSSRGKVPRLSLVPLASFSDEADEFARTATAQLATSLGRLPNLRITPVAAMGDGDNERSFVRAVATAERARFVLAGDAQLANETVRLRLRLFDGDRDRQLWAHDYDWAASEGSSIEALDAVSESVVAELGDVDSGVIPRRLLAEARREVDQPRGFEAVLLTSAYARTPNGDTYRAALSAVELAVERHADSVELWAVLAQLRIDGFSHDFVEESRASAAQRASEALAQAKALDAENPEVHLAECSTHAAARRPGELRRSADRLFALSTLPTVRALASWYLALSGDWERGLELLTEQLRLVGAHRSWLHHAFFLDHLRRGENDQAWEAAARMHVPGLPWGALDRAAALGRLGRSADARREWEDAVRIRPGVARDTAAYVARFTLQDDLVERFCEGLQAAARC